MLKPKLLTLIIIVLAVLGAYFVLSRRGSGFLNFGIFGPQASVEKSVVAELPSAPEGATSDWVEYINSDYGFSLRYPNDFSTSELEDENGRAILFQKPGAREDFQIYISEFDEEVPITPERVKKDAPDMVIENPLPVLIGEDKTIQALIFFSADSSLGRTREIWFSSHGLLFQVTARADADALIGPIMESVKF